MATFTSLGVGSGLDLNTIVTKLVALERSPLTQMQRQANTLQTSVSSFGQVSSLMSALQAASNGLTNPALWSQSAVSSGDPSAVSVSGGAGVAAGNYAVSVQALAASQTLASGAVFANSSAAVGSGTLTLQLGSWSAGQTAFTAKTGSSALHVDVTSADTLQTLRDKINSAGAGVTATLVTDTSGVRLSLRSDATGSENGFRITANDTGDGNNSNASGLSVFAFDPPSGATANQLMQGASNAAATVNGIAVVSTSNTLTSVVDGLTINLNKLSATPVNLAATPDRAVVTAAIKTFAAAYSALATYIGQQTKYDPTAKSGGPLQGDRAATNIQERLRAMVGASSGASSAFARLSDVGLQVQRDGTINVDQTQLDNAAGNLVELKKAFTGSGGGNAANDGFARRYATFTSQALGLDGVVTTRTAGLQKLISKNSADQGALNDRVDGFQSRLVAQYTALDSHIAKLNALSSYVTQQVTLWTNRNSG